MEPNQPLIPEFVIQRLFKQFTIHYPLIDASTLPHIFKQANILPTPDKVDPFFSELFAAMPQIKENSFVSQQFLIIAQLLNLYPNFTPETLKTLKTQINLPIQEIQIMAKIPLNVMVQELMAPRQAFYSEMQATGKNLVLKKTHKPDVPATCLKLLEDLLKAPKEIPISTGKLLEMVKTTNIHELCEVYNIWLTRMTKLPKLEYNQEDLKNVVEFAIKLVGIYIDFSQIDTNKNGKISIQEFVNAIEKFSIKITEDSFLKDFELINKDKDDGITFTELCEYLLPEEKLGGVNAADRLQGFFLKYDDKATKDFVNCFVSLDEDHNKKVDKREFLKGMAEKKVKINGKDLLKLFDALDKNKDGAITFQEFYDGGREIGFFTGNDVLVNPPQNNDPVIHEERKVDADDAPQNPQGERINERIIIDDIPQNNDDINNNQRIEERKNDRVPMEIEEEIKEDVPDRPLVDPLNPPPQKIPRKPSDIFEKANIRMMDYLKNDENELDNLLLAPNDEVLIYVENKVQDFFDTIKELMEKETEENGNADNLEFILQAMKSFFLIVKNENDKDAPKFLKLNDMMADTIKELKKYTQDRRLNEVQKYYAHFIEMKNKIQSDMFKEFDIMKNDIVDLKKKLQKKTDKYAARKVFSNAQQKKNQDLETEFEKQKNLKDELQNGKDALNAEIDKIKINFEVQGKEKDFLAKRVKDLQTTLQDKEILFKKREDDLNEREGKLVLNLKKFEDKQEEFKIECKKQQEINSATEQNLELKKKESDELRRSTWSEIHKHSDFEQKELLKLITKYKEELELKKMIEKFNEKRLEGSTGLNWEEERQQMCGIINEFKQKVMELESNLDQNRIEKKKLEQDNEKLKEICEDLENKMEEMKNSIGTTNTPTDDGMGFASKVMRVFGIVKK